MADALRPHLPGASGHAGIVVERAELAGTVTRRREDRGDIGLKQARVGFAEGMHDGRRQTEHARLAQQPLRELAEQWQAADQVVDRAAVLHPHHDARAEMVAEVLADTGKVVANLDAELLQQRARAYARELQQLGRIHRTSADDDLAPRVDFELLAAAGVRHAAGAAAFEHDRIGMRVGDHGQTAALHRRVQIGARRADAAFAFDDTLVVTDTVSALAVVVGVARVADARRAVDERFAQRMLPGQVGDRQLAVVAAPEVVVGSGLWACASACAGTRASTGPRL